MLFITSLATLPRLLIKRAQGIIKSPNCLYSSKAFSWVFVFYTFALPKKGFFVKMKEMFKWLSVFLLALTPLGELRAAIPVGLAVYHLPWPAVLAVAVLANLLPAVFWLLFLNPLSGWLSAKSAFCRNFFQKLFNSTRKKHQAQIEKYGWWGLMSFVAIPLPLTGAWTGALIAFLVGMPFSKALSAISVGVVVAGVIVTAIVKAGLVISDYFGFKTLLIVALLIIAVWALVKYVKNNSAIGCC